MALLGCERRSSFDAPEMRDKRITITAGYVRERLSDVVKDEDLSKFIL